MLFQRGLQVQGAASSCLGESIGMYLVIDSGGPTYALID